MKHIQITSELLKQTKPQDIIYADYNKVLSCDAAMTRFYTIDDEKLNFYLIHVGMDSEEYVLFNEVVQFLTKCEEEQILEGVPAGGRGKAFRRCDVELDIGDNRRSFLYRQNDKTYKIMPSYLMFKNASAAFAKH